MMKNNTLYTESQSFFSWLLCLVLLTVSVASFSVHWQEILRLDFVPLFQLPGFWINLVLWVLFGILRLKTNIREDGIEVYFFPFNFYRKRALWTDIRAVEVRKYNPIGEFGGWGLRRGWKGQAFSARGNMGLQLTLETGKVLLIGTQNPVEIEQLNLSQFLKNES
ncbi:hypothetical protein [Sphingobacterium multivorum]|uniref:hypothetical protein n=1 Tax=Sphingobacterium multivorum TaxID=28454 RepID=UPI0028AED1A7|nr:hypothetical protein [Sphingobacterium multivorum]